VHGTIEEGETPVQASLRELREETGLTPDRFYNLSRIEGFYQHKSDELVIIPAFAAFVAADALPLLSREHDAFVWLTPRDAAKRFAWPRERRALEDVLSIVGSGGGGLLDDVLRVS
jgi:8-oxo-dGTP pyrophosphatase MutT (NUDIX family)